MQRLVPFKNPDFEISLSADMQIEENLIHLIYQIDTEAEITWPQVTPSPTSREGLYNSTCFELFLTLDETHYLEWNFSPSKDWYGFLFDGYRKPIQNIDQSLFKPKSFEIAHQTAKITIDWKKLANTISPSLNLQMKSQCVVIQRSSELSLWASKHPQNKPDFHDLSCFVPLKF